MRIKVKNRFINELQWYSFLLPSIICLVVMTYMPTFTSLKYSFYKVSVIGFGEKFIGLKNYEVLLNSTGFYRSLANTIILVLLGYIVIPSGFIIASLINSMGRNKLQSFFRVGFYIPNIITGVSVILLFRYILLQNGGLLNSGLSLLTGENVTIGWLVDPKISKVGMSIMGIWAGLGYNMLVCLAGLQSIPHEIYESASVDGCNGIKKWWYITTPNMMGTFVFLFITSTISGFARFTDLFIISNNSAAGGVGASLQSLLMYVYQYSFVSPNYGLSSAGVMILFVIVFTATLINLHFTKLLKE